MSNNVRTNSFLVDLQNGTEVKQRIQSDKVKTRLSNIFLKVQKMVSSNGNTTKHEF